VDEELSMSEHVQRLGHDTHLGVCGSGKHEILLDGVEVQPSDRACMLVALEDPCIIGTDSRLAASGCVTPAAPTWNQPRSWRGRKR
jgi:hypothetical protein